MIFCPVMQDQSFDGRVEKQIYCRQRTNDKWHFTNHIKRKENILATGENSEIDNTAISSDAKKKIDAAIGLLLLRQNRK
ncbi:hypothetical protein NUSPORA_00141 [Nucleospora cyclopteri]